MRDIVLQNLLVIELGGYFKEFEDRWKKEEQEEQDLVLQ